MDKTTVRLLEEISTRRNLILKYDVVGETGEPYLKQIEVTVSVTIDGSSVQGSGVGNSENYAKNSAAKYILQKFLSIPSLDLSEIESLEIKRIVCSQERENDADTSGKTRHRSLEFSPQRFKDGGGRGPSSPPRGPGGAASGPSPRKRQCFGSPHHFEYDDGPGPSSAARGSDQPAPRFERTRHRSLEFSPQRFNDGGGRGPSSSPRGPGGPAPGQSPRNRQCFGSPHHFEYDDGSGASSAARGSGQPAHRFEEHGRCIEDLWKDIQNGLDQLYKGHMSVRTITSPTIADLQTSIVKYTSCIRISGGPQNEETDLRRRLKSYLTDYVNRLSKDGIGLGDELLDFYINQWKAYRKSSEVLDAACQYLNENWVNSGPHTDVVYRMAASLWRKAMFIDRTNVLEAVARLVKLDKELNASAYEVLSCFHELGLDDAMVYDAYFEKPFLELAKQIYRNERASFIHQCRMVERIPDVDHSLIGEIVAEFMQLAENLLKCIPGRLGRYLPRRTLAQLQEVCQTEIVENTLYLICPELIHFCNLEKVSDIARMYRLLKTPEDMKPFWKACMIRQGLEIWNGARNDPLMYVANLLELQRKHKSIVSSAFCNDQEIAAASEEAYREFINSSANNNEMPELLAKIFDLLLRSQNEGELEGKLDGVMIIFRHLSDLDTFREFYRVLLARRLLSKFNYDAERRVLGVMRKESGFDCTFTTKLQRMIKDIRISEALTEIFRRSHFEAKVLTTGSWPVSASQSLHLPPELKDCTANFELFYKSRYESRKLTWLSGMGSGELAANFERKYTILASTAQMAVLMLFNECESYSFEELTEMTAIATDALIPIIKSLVRSKLLQIRDGSSVKNTTVSVNTAYQNDRLRVNINAPVKFETEAEREERKRHLEAKRKSAVQAAIVRVMKKEREMEHRDMTRDVVAQLKSRFKPDNKLVKKCVEILIGKEYIERKAGDHQTYCYLA